MRSVLACLARATKSFRSLAGLDGWVTITEGVIDSSATGVSASSLYGWSERIRLLVTVPLLPTR